MSSNNVFVKPVSLLERFQQSKRYAIPECRHQDYWMAIEAKQEEDAMKADEETDEETYDSNSGPLLCCESASSRCFVNTPDNYKLLTNLAQDCSKSLKNLSQDSMHPSLFPDPSTREKFNHFFKSYGKYPSILTNGQYAIQPYSLDVDEKWLPLLGLAKPKSSIKKRKAETTDEEETFMRLGAE